MTATRLDISIEQGADYDGSFAILGPTGAPLDLTGYAAAMQIRLLSIYPTPLLTLTSIDGTLLIDAAAGTVTPVIPASVSAALNAGHYLYDLKLVSPAGHTTRAYSGSAYVSAEVTDTIILPPTAYGALLLEGGGYLLLENGGRLLLEDGVYSPGAILLESGGCLLLESGGRLLVENGTTIPGAILLESGGYLLNETGGKFLLEA